MWDYFKYNCPVSGVNAAKRAMMGATAPSVEITFDGTIFKETIKTKIRDFTLTCPIGEEFTHDIVELGGSRSVSCHFLS